ncbi:MAG: hypothetical protein ACK5MT_01410 [Actinomycetales bacterium]
MVVNFFNTLLRHLSNEHPRRTTVYDEDLSIPHRTGAVVVTVAHHVRAHCEPRVAEFAAARYFEDLVFGFHGVSPTQRRWLAFVQIADEPYPTLFEDADAAARRAMTLIGTPDAEITTVSFLEDDTHRDVRDAYPWSLREQLQEWTLSELVAGLHIEETEGVPVDRLVRMVDDLTLGAQERELVRRQRLVEFMWNPPVMDDANDDWEDWDDSEGWG